MSLKAFGIVNVYGGIIKSLDQNVKILDKFWKHNRSVEGAKGVGPQQHVFSLRGKNEG